MSRAEPDDMATTRAQMPAGIVCDNCGAKWRLPSTWKGPTANCQRCGSSIDAQVQLDAGATGRPLAAAARPAVDRARSQAATRVGRPTERATSAQSPKATAGHGDSRVGKGDRGPRDERRGGGSPLPWLFAGCALCVLGAIAFMASR